VGLEQHVLAWITQYGYLAIFLLLMFGIVGLPVPDETLLTFTGYLVYRGDLNLGLAFGTALAGSVAGITISYWLGRFFGMKLIHSHGKYLRISPEHFAKAHAWFERIGHWGLTFGYFIPGVRHLTAYAAGISELAPHHFALFAYAGSVLWVSTFIGLGYFLGERWEAVEKNIHHYLTETALAMAIAVVAFLAWRMWRRKRSAR
jgi:membrane protein DedA with SNARE-associated domain